MKVCILYIAVTHGNKTSDYIARFASTYHEHPPEYEHHTIVCCNGGPLSKEQCLLFSGIKCDFWPRANDPGYDLSAYMAAAKTVAADFELLLCLGESNYFWKPGWLKRIVQAVEKHGEGMYGPFATHVVRAHLQTTAFAISPRLLLDYPLPVVDRVSRYEMEHGERALWRRLHRKGYPVNLVTWDGEWNPGQWRVPKNNLWSGDQSNVLWRSIHTQRWEEADQKRKRSWELSANRPFR